MASDDERSAALDKAADEVRARVEDSLKETLERGLATGAFAVPPRHSRVDHVVSDLLDPSQMERADEGLLDIGDIDDDEKFRAFAERLTGLKESSAP